MFWAHCLPFMHPVTKSSVKFKHIQSFWLARFTEDVRGRFSRLKAVLRTQARFAVLSSVKNCADLHTLLTDIEFFLKSRSDAEKPSSIVVRNSSRLVSRCG